MSLTNVVMDAGNSQVKWGVWSGGDQVPRRDPRDAFGLLPAAPLPAAGSCATPAGAADTAALCRAISATVGDPSGLRVALVSVVPAVNAALAGITGDLRLADHTASLPFRLGVAEPARVGPDRLCNMAAAAVAGFSSALVVDAGTATTFDLLLDGEFVGGMIAPGMAFAARRLGEAAPMLAPVPFGPASWEVGRDTAAALTAGAWHTGVGGVLAAIAGIRAHYGAVPVILTGGLGRHLESDILPYDPEWTMRGSALLCNL